MKGLELASECAQARAVIGSTDALIRTLDQAKFLWGSAKLIWLGKSRLVQGLEPHAGDLF